LQAGDCDGYLARPGPSLGEAESQAAAAAGQASGDGEDAQAQAFRFPVAGDAGEGEELGPGQELAGEGGDLAPQLVLVEAVQREVPSARCPWRSGCGPRTWPGGGDGVPGQRAARAFASVAKAVNRWPSTPVNRSCAPRCGRSLRMMTRPPGRPGGQVEEAGHVRDPGPVPGLPVPVIGRRPRRRGDF
jgi:hypothetical protein